MTALQFITALVVSLVVLFLGISWLALHYDTQNLEKENEKLKEDIKKLRQRKSKQEYNKVKIGGKKQ